MYLHIGNNRIIRERDVIGIFDADSATVSGITRKYLAQAERRGVVSSAVEELPKSFVLYREGSEVKVCFSQISTTALLGRTGKTN